ncbi:MAG: tetratricopeptide repeat protein, partial [Opitutales bacterium]|nr:tetratricopeptide repeat protein [Opitutales bacterium]
KPEYRFQTTNSKADRLLAVAEEIDSRSFNPSALGKVAAAYTRAGDPEEGRSIVGKLEGHHRIRANREIAGALAKAGHPDEALEVLGEHGSSGPMSVLIQVVSAYVEKGEIERARAILPMMDWRSDRVSGLLHIESALRKKGEATIAREALDKALRSTLLIDDSAVKAALLMEIAKRMDAHGDSASGIELTRTAEKRAREVRDPWARAVAFSEISATAAEMGYEYAESESFVKALTTARGIERVTVRALALTNIADHRFAAGRHDEGHRLLSEALNLARSANEREERTQIFCTLAQVHAGVGDLKKARSVLREAQASARSIPDPNDRSNALADIELRRFRIGNQLRGDQAANRP